MPQKSLLTWAGYTFDVVQSETVSDAAQLAQHPLEDGSLVSDHLIQTPTPVSAEVLVTDIPGDGTAYQLGRSNDVYLSLLQELGRGTESDLSDGVRVYPDMILTAVSRTRGAPEGVARLSLRWDPVRRASGLEVAVPLPHTSTVGAAKQSVGKKAPEAVPAATQAKASTILFDLIN